MRSLTTPYDNPTLGRDPVNERRPAASLASPLQTLLYGLSAVTALPPDAILAPPKAALPRIRACSHPVLHALELESPLGRPTARVGHGSVALEQVDWRMRGLVASLDMSRTVDESAMLIGLGVVEPDRTASRAGAPTADNLWELVCETLPRHAVVSQPEAAINQGALLVPHGDIVAQMVWLSEDRLATVTVTSLRGEAPIQEAARSIASVLSRLLTDERWSAGSASRVWPGPYSM